MASKAKVFIPGFTRIQDDSGKSVIEDVNFLRLGPGLALHKDNADPSACIDFEIEPIDGTDIPDAPTTISVDGGSRYFMRSATATRIITLGTDGSPVAGEQITVNVVRDDAFTVVFKDDNSTSLITVPASVKMSVSFRFDGTHFASPVAVRIN